MNKREFIDLCPAYALGALEGEDLIRFREMLAYADGDMKKALAGSVKIAQNLSLAAPAASPSSAVKKRLMARIEARAEALGAAEARDVENLMEISVEEELAAAPLETPAVSPLAPVASPVAVPLPDDSAWEPARVRRFPDPESSWFTRLFGASAGPRLGYVAAFALLIATVGLAAYVSSLTKVVTHQRVALRHSSGRIIALEDSLSRKEAMLEVIRARGMQVVSMSGMEGSPSGYGRILWDPERKTAVLNISLPPQPADKDYQLWVIRDKKPMGAGVFQVKSDGSGGSLYKIDELVETDRAHINAFAVTLEPKGGMPQPTGKMYLLGSI